MPHRQRSAAYPPVISDVDKVGTGRLSSRVIEGTLTLLLSLSEVLPSNRRRIDPAVEKIAQTLLVFSLLLLLGCSSSPCCCCWAARLLPAAAAGLLVFSSLLLGCSSSPCCCCWAARLLLPAAAAGLLVFSLLLGCYPLLLISFQVAPVRPHGWKKLDSGIKLAVITAVKQFFDIGDYEVLGITNLEGEIEKSSR
ncbi:hypothetical protein AAC387_Pa01g4112 [Persea americana]